MPGTIMPRQFGPTTRSVNGRAASRMAFLMATPPASSRVALITIAARVPRAPSAAISSGALAAGVTITARSGAAGNSATDAKHGMPSTRPP